MLNTENPYFSVNKNSEKREILSEVNRTNHIKYSIAMSELSDYFASIYIYNTNSTVIQRYS